MIAFGADQDGGDAARALRLARGRGCSDGRVQRLSAPSASSTPPTSDRDLRQELVETFYHVLWELVHVFFEHRGLLAGRDPRRSHDAGASSFLYPFLDERERELEPVVEDVRRSVLMKAAEIAALREQTLADNAGVLIDAAQSLRAALERGGKLLALGNGGSATDAMDVVADFRAPVSGGGRGWPAIDLTEDPGIITAIANDIGTDAIFLRQVIAYGAPGDALLALSTSGNSVNVIEALVRGATPRSGHDRDGRLRRRADRRRSARRSRDRDPIRAHPADPGGAGERVSRAAGADRLSRVAADPVEHRGDAQPGGWRRAQIRVIGTVQGVGFRPYVHRLAGELALGGWVLNDAQGVLLEIEGSERAVTEFRSRLTAQRTAAGADRAGAGLTRRAARRARV